MKHTQTLLALTCVTFIASANAVTTAHADGEALKPESKLLALGDSIAFGYDPTADFSNEDNFEGYPEKLKKDGSGNYAVSNASCPGETTGSFISTTAPDNGCRAYRTAYPLHVDYSGAQTQLDYAISKLSSEEIELVTLNLSANDIFLLQQSCSQDPANYQTCFSAGFPAVVGAIAQNLNTIFSRIRGEAGYDGRIVFVNLYTVDYSDANAVMVVSTVNSYAAQVASAYGVEIADAFSALAAASNNGSACDANLLIKLPDGTCDVHPSNQGDKIIAEAIANAQ